MFTLGENPYGDIETMGYSEGLIYFLFTYLVTIIAFNLLIAILSETYDNV